MVRHEDGCVGCAAPGYPCLGSACPNNDVIVLVCDECGAEGCDDLWELPDGRQVCQDCLMDEFPRVE